MADLSRIKEVYFAVVDRPVAERDAFLERECAGDITLSDAVQRLLKARRTSTGFLSDPTFTSENTNGENASTSSRPAPDTIICGGSSYDVGEVLGRGGSGTVYRARQKRPVQRTVALKLIQVEDAHPQTQRRFENEKQALAMMDHQHIAQVYDAGVTEDGLAYVAMELVDGEPITIYCETKQVSIKGRLELFAATCGAIQHAHNKGIVHRDIKPSNILVRGQDSGPAPKVIDFGIATGESIGAGTEQGGLMGTPAYMSPEQAGSEARIDTQTDVYSLGVVLYELLTGTPPLLREQFKGLSRDLIIQAIREKEAPPASIRALAHNSSGAKTSKFLAGDLDAITAKALAHDRTQRYATAESLAQDVRRFLNCKPVEAMTGGDWYRLRKFVKRHRKGFILASLVAAALVVGVTLAGLALVHANSRTRMALEQSEKANDALRLLGIQASLGSSLEAQPALRQALDAFSGGIDADQITAPAVAARLLENIGHAYHGMGDFDPAANYLEKGLARVESGMGKASAEYANLLFSLAIVERDRARFEVAARHSSRARELFSKRSGARSSAALKATALTGDLLFRAGKIQEASDKLRTLDPWINELNESGKGNEETLRDEIAETLRPHANRTALINAAKRQLGHLSNDAAARVSVRHWLLDLALGSGDYEAAQVHARRAREDSQQAFDENDPRALISQSRLAEVRVASGEPAEALELMKETMPLQDSLLESENPAVLVADLVTAEALLRIGDPPKALANAIAVQKATTEQFSSLHPLTLQAGIGVANSLRHTNQITGAEEAGRASATGIAKFLWPNHAQRFHADLERGRLYRGLKRYDDATNWFKSLHEECLREFGATHRLTLLVSFELGVLAHLEGRLADAYNHLHETLNTQTEGLGAMHPDRLETMLELGKVCLRQERSWDYTDLMEAWFKAEPTRAVNARIVAQQRLTLARFYQLRSHLSDAGRHLKAAQDLARRSLPDDSREAIDSALSQYKELVQHRMAIAESNRRNLNALIEEGSSAESILEARHAYGLALIRQHTLEAAQIELEKAELEAKALHGEGEKHTSVVVDLGTCLARQGDLEMWEHLLRSVLEPSDGLPLRGNRPERYAALNDFLFVYRTGRTGVFYNWCDRAEDTNKGALWPKNRTVILIPRSTRWDYLDDGSDQGIQWRHPQFKASSWKEGEAPIGNDGSMIATVAGESSSYRDPVTIYYRRSFQIESVAALESVKIRLRRSDGAKVYLNGKLIARSNLDVDSNYRTPAARAMNRVGGAWPYSFVVGSDVLVSGENLIAVEVHRARGQRDSVFDLQLEALQVPYRIPELGENSMQE